MVAGMTKKKPTKAPSRQLPPAPRDSFEETARRLECDPDMDKFDRKLRKIAKAKPGKK